MARKTGKRSSKSASKPSKRSPKARSVTESSGDTADLLTMEQAIKRLKTTRPTFYRWLRSGKIKGSKVGRQWRFRPEDIDRFLSGDSPRIDLAASPAPLLEALDEKLASLKVNADGVDSGLAGEDEMSRAVHRIILFAMRLEASDIHVIPRGSDGGARPAAMIRFRVAGVLCHPIELDARLLPALIAKWKTLAACDVNETRRPQDGRIMANVGGEHVDLRVCFIPAVGGEAVTLRLLRKGSLVFDLEQIGYSEADLKRIHDGLNLPNGILLFVGPAGTGKTTTMYSALSRLNRPELKLLTFEDPVEYTFPGMVQMQKDDEAGLNFHNALRSILRSDPDIVMVGEIRDLQTLQILTQTALTGHLVLSTLHTDDAPSTPMRMLDIGLNPFLVADALRLVVAQRLIRKLCPHCSRATELGSEDLAQAMSLTRIGGVAWDSLPHDFREPVGCDKCGQTGYRGRMIIAETMVVTPELGSILRRGGSVHEVRSLAIGQGMTTMHADGIRRAAEGRTTIAEVFRTLPPNR